MSKSTLILIMIFCQRCFCPLRSVTLPDGTTVIPFRVKTNQNGKLTSIDLVNPLLLSTSVGNVRVKSISCCESGRIKDLHVVGWFRTSLQTSIGKLRVRKIVFYENGKIMELELAREQDVYTLGGIVKVKGSILFLRKWYGKSSRAIETTKSENTSGRSKGKRICFLSSQWCHQNCEVIWKDYDKEFLG